ncbi:expressed unknown protein [Seminavis robusta]|uniref:Uncharacterized protein n=1 Tax=Seminavis robusta TaxID=568900 RepID=A0A9N8DBS1_9STRA|nr:expressed unknown protein [Seminavis robusta]|eukprot:Sro22_g015150.1 n/a (649) ;mRNA; f:21441-23387
MALFPCGRRFAYKFLFLSLMVFGAFELYLENDVVRSALASITNTELDLWHTANDWGIHNPFITPEDQRMAAVKAARASKSSQPVALTNKNLRNKLRDGRAKVRANMEKQRQKQDPNTKEGAQKRNDKKPKKKFSTATSTGSNLLERQALENQEESLKDTSEPTKQRQTNLKKKKKKLDEAFKEERLSLEESTKTKEKVNEEAKIEKRAKPAVDTENRSDKLEKTKTYKAQATVDKKTQKHLSTPPKKNDGLDKASKSDAANVDTVNSKPSHASLRGVTSSATVDPKTQVSKKKKAVQLQTDNESVGEDKHAMITNDKSKKQKKKQKVETNNADSNNRKHDVELDDLVASATDKGKDESANRRTKTKESTGTNDKESKAKKAAAKEKFVGAVEPLSQTTITSDRVEPGTAKTTISTEERIAKATALINRARLSRSSAKMGNLKDFFSAKETSELDSIDSLKPEIPASSKNKGSVKSVTTKAVKSSTSKTKTTKERIAAVEETLQEGLLEPDIGRKKKKEEKGQGNKKGKEKEIMDTEEEDPGQEQNKETMKKAAMTRTKQATFVEAAQKSKMRDQEQGNKKERKGKENKKLNERETLGTEEEGAGQGRMKALLERNDSIKPRRIKPVIYKGWNKRGKRTDETQQRREIS